MKPDLKEIFGSYQAKKLNDTTWIIAFMEGSQYLYLLEGEQKALLIDTGYGSGNLKAFVENLTSKPLMVLNTHFHPDHAGGNGEFERVYMSRGEALDKFSLESPGASPFPLNQLPHPDYEKVYLQDGDLIDLGGRQIEVLEAKPAHCNSSLFLLDRTQKLLFVGDEFEAGQVLLFDNSKNPEAGYDARERLDALKANATRLMAMEELYDTVLPNHNGTPIEKTYLKEFAELVDALYTGEATIEEHLNHPFIERDPVAPELCRVRWKRASIFIKKADVMF